MNYETLPNGLQLPKIGFGTWRIGGDESANGKRDERSLAALRSALEIGYTHFDTAEMYASGHSEELIGQAILESKIKREDLFVTSKVLPSHLKYKDVLLACENSLKRLQTDYLDLYLIHWPSAGMDLDDTFRALNELVRTGKVRYLGVSNFSISLMKKSQVLSETALITNQVPYSLSDRSYVKNGVLDFCLENNILLTAYSPVDEGKLKTNHALEKIAETHNATVYQIALAWITQQRGVITIPMSFNPQHIKENYIAAEIVLSKEERDLLKKGR